MRCGSRGAVAGRVLIRVEGATADAGKGHGVGEGILQCEGRVAMDSFFSVFSVWVRWPGLQGKSHSVRRLELLMGPAVAHWFSS